MMQEIPRKESFVLAIAKESYNILRDLKKNDVAQHNLLQPENESASGLHKPAHASSSLHPATLATGPTMSTEAAFHRTLRAEKASEEKDKETTAQVARAHYLSKLDEYKH
eukprot:6208394-Pleurochrysis_carterae.AAC.2